MAFKLLVSLLAWLDLRSTIDYNTLGVSIETEFWKALIMSFKGWAVFPKSKSCCKKTQGFSFWFNCYITFTLAEFEQPIVIAWILSLSILKQGLCFIVFLQHDYGIWSLELDAVDRSELSRPTNGQTRPLKSGHSSARPNRSESLATALLLYIHTVYM